MSTKAVSYPRVSGKGQLAGDGLPRQHERIAQYAQHNDFTIELEREERGVTGDSNVERRILDGHPPRGLEDMPERKALSELVGYARRNDIHVLLVENASRLSRESLTQQFLLLWLERDGIRVVSAEGGIDLTDGTPVAKLIRTVLGAVAEYDKDSTVLRLRHARERLRQAGVRQEGQIRFGQKNGEETVLTHILSMARSGLGPTDIAQELNREGHKTRNGKPWQSGTVWKIVNRELCT
jgi:DNA invertase Pin-like site-specific DNA recombinase